MLDTDKILPVGKSSWNGKRGLAQLQCRECNAIPSVCNCTELGDLEPYNSSAIESSSGARNPSHVDIYDADMVQGLIKSKGDLGDSQIRLM